MSRLPLRPAFTLVEVLVCLAITGLLLGLLLPAVAAVRESARLTACRHNARQIGLAMHSLAARSGRLPANQPVPWTVDAVRLLDPTLVPPGSAADHDIAWDQTPAAKVAVAPLACPSAPPVPGEERAIANHGLNHRLPGLRLAAIVDGLSHTLLTGEIPSESAAPWTWGPLADELNIGSAHHRRINVTLADGSARALALPIDSAVLRSLLDPDDGPAPGLD
jgi:prepilin-type N-terminal cleavage/methylation domain-containing protein